MSLLDELLELESRYWEATGKPEFYEANFANDGLMAFHVGIFDKVQVVESMRGADEWARYTIDNPRLIVIGADTAALVYEASAVAADGDDEYRAVITSVYALRGGNWTLVLHQQTPSRAA